MANEFVARKGLIVSGSTLITGSLNVTRGITGSLFGTSSWANNAISASWAPVVLTGVAVNIDEDIFEGNGVTTQYTLSDTYNIDSLTVVVGGLTQTKTVDYSLSGTTLSFTYAPPSQSNIIVRALLNATSNAIGTFTGSFLGTITSASYAVTASYALNAAGGTQGSGESFHPFLLAGL
jgi:hypothetical protein